MPPLLVEKQFPTARWTRTDSNEGHFELEPTSSSVPWLTVDPSKLDPMNINPLVQHCKPIVVTLQPGEVLYLPSLWFHAVHQEADVQGLCVAVNYWYDMDYTGPVYSLYNYLRRSTMLFSGRTKEVQLELEQDSEG
jgi:peptidyl-lysine (3S)-dioxygenase / protease